MRCMYVADFLYISESGAHTSACAHLNTLRSIFGRNNVDVISLVGKRKVDAKYEDTLVISNDINPVALFFNCLRGYPTYLGKKGIKLIMSLIDENVYDVIFIDNSIYGILAKQIKEANRNIPIVSYYHDVKASLAMKWKENAPIFKKPVYEAMIKNERLNQEYCDVNLVLNKRETKLFQVAYGRSPEGQLAVYMDIPKQELKDNNIHDTLEILFLGGYYLPNVKGIMWFVNRVLPLLKNVHLSIAGREMEKLLDEQTFPDNVSVLGRVENLSRVYNMADVVISPIFEGGGMKVKVAEAMGYGKMIIGTDESYEGYAENINEADWNKYFFRANTPEEFMSAINSIRNNQIELSKYNNRVRFIYEEKYSPRHAQDVITGAIELAKEKCRK